MGGAAVDDVERPAPLYLVEGAGAHRSFGRDLGEALGIAVAPQLGDVLVQEMVSGPPRVLEFTGGRCACGRSSLVLARCGQCIRADRELADEARLAEEQESVQEVAAVGGALARPPAAAGGALARPQPAVAVGPGPCIAVSPSLVLELLAFGGERVDFVCANVRVRRAKDVGRSGAVPLEAARGFPYRLACFVVKCRPGAPQEVALAQPCVETDLELVTELDVRQLVLPVGVEFVQLFASAWLLWDSSFRQPAFGATHVHRHCRGSAVKGGVVVKVSTFSAAYSEVFAGAFGLAWHRALEKRFGGRATDAFALLQDSNFARGERESYDVPDIAQVARRARVGPERGTVEFDAEVAEGRKLEDVDIRIREAFAAQVRGTEPEAGSEPFELMLSLRALIIGDQWKDEELGPLCLKLRPM